MRRATHNPLTTAALLCLLAGPPCGLGGPARRLVQGRQPSGGIRHGPRRDRAPSGGKSSATVKSIAQNLNGFGTLMQMSQPGEIPRQTGAAVGIRQVRQGHDWAGLWFRVDGPNNGEPQSLAFDNMQERPIKGTTDWTRYEIVLDVPEAAQRLAFGILLAGGGQVWMDDLKFEVVPTTVKTTATPIAPRAAGGADESQF